MELTDIGVANLAPKPKPYDRRAARGLYLRVYPNGRKTWVIRYQVLDARYKLNVGEYPALGLSAARGLTQTYLAIAKEGKDPAIEHKAAKDALRGELTLEAAAREFWDQDLKERKSGPETWRMLQKDVIPRIGTIPMKEIRRRDVVLVVDQVRRRGDITANRTLGAISRLFSFALDRGIIEEPLAMPRKKSEKDRTRSRVLSDEEIRLFWEATDPDNLKIDMFRQTKLALRLILLTGQRPGEVVGMGWQELDDVGNWNIPAARMKGKRPHTVPLPSLAHELLEEARKIPARIEARKIQKMNPTPMPDENFVFCSSHGTGHVTVNAMSMALRRHYPAMGRAKARFTPHDLRRTMRTRLAEIGVDDVVAEKLLAHKLQGVLGIYNRHAYLDEKRAAMMRWEANLKRLVGIEAAPDTSNVIAVQFGKK